MRPSLSASKSGSLPPLRSASMRAVMKTVLPARDSPVTPSLRLGLASPLAKSLRPPAASRPVSMMSESFTPCPVIAPQFGDNRARKQEAWLVAAVCQNVLGSDEAPELSCSLGHVLPSIGQECDVDEGPGW